MTLPTYSQSILMCTFNFLGSFYSILTVTFILMCCSPPLSTPGMPDVDEAISRQRHPVCHSIWNVGCKIICCQATVLLLAAIRRQAVRQKGTAVQVL